MSAGRSIEDDTIVLGRATLHELGKPIEQGRLGRARRLYGQLQVSVQRGQYGFRYGLAGILADGFNIR